MCIKESGVAGRAFREVILSPVTFRCWVLALQEDPGQLQHRSDKFRSIDASATGLKVDAATALNFAGWILFIAGRSVIASAEVLSDTITLGFWELFSS
jgi:hypothetical protein